MKCNEDSLSNIILEWSFHFIVDSCGYIFLIYACERRKKFLLLSDTINFCMKVLFHLHYKKSFLQFIALLLRANVMQFFQLKRKKKKKEQAFQTWI